MRVDIHGLNQVLRLQQKVLAAVAVSFSLTHVASVVSKGHDPAIGSSTLQSGDFGIQRVGALSDATCRV